MKYDIELIDRYIAGELSENEMKAIEQRIKEDKDFAHEVLLHQMAVEAVTFNNFRNRVQEVRADMKKEREESPIIPIDRKRRNLLRRLAVAATVLVIVSLVYFLTNPLKVTSAPSELMASLEKELNPFKSPSMGSPENNKILKIINDKIYIPTKREDSLLLPFSDEIKPEDILQQIKKDNKNIDIGAVYELGVYHFNKEEYAKAHLYFDLIITNGPARRPEAHFYKGYAYFKANELTRSKQEFEAILKDNRATEDLKIKVSEIMKAI